MSYAPGWPKTQAGQANILLCSPLKTRETQKTRGIFFAKAENAAFSLQAAEFLDKLK